MYRRATRCVRSGGTRTRSRSGSFRGSAGRRSVPQIVQNCDSSSSHTTVQSLETKSAPATRQVLEAPTTPAPIHTLPDSFDNSSTNTVPLSAPASAPSALPGYPAHSFPNDSPTTHTTGTSFFLHDGGPDSALSVSTHLSA